MILGFIDQHAHNLFTCRLQYVLGTFLRFYHRLRFQPFQPCSPDHSILSLNLLFGFLDFLFILGTIFFQFQRTFLIFRESCLLNFCKLFLFFLCQVNS